MNELDFGDEMVLLTSSHIKEWLAERERLRAQRETIDAKLAEIDDRLLAAQKLADFAIPGQAPDIATGLVGAGEETMVDAARRILKEAGGWITHKEIKRGLRKIPHLNEMMKASPNYYYTMISRMVEREDVVKDGKKYRYIGM